MVRKVYLLNRVPGTQPPNQRQIKHSKNPAPNPELDQACDQEGQRLLWEQRADGALWHCEALGLPF